MAETPPNLTLVTPARLLPEMLTRVPGGPLVGEKELMVGPPGGGAGGVVNVTVVSGQARAVPPLSSTTASTVAEPVVVLFSVATATPELFVVVDTIARVEPEAVFEVGPTVTVPMVLVN